MRLHGVASELIGFKTVSSHIHTKGFTELFSFEISQHIENNLAIFKMTKYVKKYISRYFLF